MTPLVDKAALRPKLQPGTRWIVAIVALLAINVIAGVILAVAATNGHTQVIPAYYERAVHYDDALDEATRSTALGWRAHAEIVGQAIAVDVRDASGAPLGGSGEAVVRVTGYQRAHASDVIDTALVLGSDGRYHGSLLGARRGVYDVAISVERGHDRFVQRAAIEAR
jgi:nitrogen fixation protein FixH